MLQLLGAFDITEPAARVAINRLAARGALILERRGRTTWYCRSRTLLAILAQGRAITERFGPPRTGWDGTWTVLTWSIPDRATIDANRLRRDLRELGFAPLSSGVWVSPDPSTDRLAATLSNAPDLRHSIFTSAQASGVDPRRAWDPHDIRTAYDEFLSEFRPVLARAHRSRFRDRDALVARTRAVYRWFVIATIDPDLPEELVPKRWPRARAHELSSTSSRR